MKSSNDVSTDDGITIQTAVEVSPSLLRMLDRGIEDIENDRVLDHGEAMKEVRNIRDARRQSRLNAGVAIHGTL